ncbi:M90 family metallopeptidase [Pseudooceanicola sp.]|uniref:M90 family metallopeptidase n=1 Tax=Pseudooceanicola sp. TaxID=1914328 RepID=UPI002639C4DF|nr:M90 family metallopeptidase [Pseudooceanicola sp.]MDF1855989.1 zinc-dependent peptidase [Pseudooceanicola sp.]
MWIVLLLLLLGASLVAYRAWSKRRARARLLATALSAEQRAIVETSVPLTRRLPTELRGKLDGKITLFLDQIEFIGCNGLEVTEDIELSIAAQACLLVVNTDTWFSNLRTILVYPGAFKSRRKEQNGYVVTERETVRTGESWARGPVILSWADAAQGAEDTADGHNVVFHEFAHQIDDLSGRTDGIPVLNRGQSLAEWHRVIGGAFHRHVGKVEHGHRAVFDAYGAVAPEEFFAVAVEVFFEQPTRLAHEEPEVYRQLAALFRLDPATWD